MNAPLIILILVIVQALVVVAMWGVKQVTEAFAHLIDTQNDAMKDVLRAQERALSIFVEQAKVSGEQVTAVLAPPPVVESPKPTVVETGDLDGARMYDFSDFDDSDPTDAFLKPERSDGAVGLEGDDPFGVPGLKVVRPSAFDVVV